MSEGRGGGYSRSTIYSQLPRGTFWNRPPGYIYNQIILFKWNGSGWGSCRDSGGYTNQVTTYGFFLTWNFGSNPPCGVGYYGTRMHMCGTVVGGGDRVVAFGRVTST